MDYLGVSMNGVWVTSNRREIAYIDNLKFTCPSIGETEIDLAPDLFEVEVEVGKEPEESEDSLITCYIAVPEGYDINDIDVSTVTLSLDETILATAEYFDAIDNILVVNFKLDLNNVSGILGIEVAEVESDEEKVEVKALDYLDKEIELIELTISGDFLDGGSFTGSDAIRVMAVE